MTSSERPVCTFGTLNGEPVTQHMYRCVTCHFSETETICEGCAKFCHQGHELVDLGIIYGICHCGNGCIHCHCFLMHPVPGDEEFEPDESRQCEFNRTGPNFKGCYQNFCYTCGLHDNRICCTPCIRLCHRGHDVKFDAYSPFAYCDCGDFSQNHHCLIKPDCDAPPPPPVCTFNIGKKKPLKQAGYVCDTCNIKGICKACAQVCHKGHKVRKIQLGAFSCHCGSNHFKCILMQNQPPAN